MHPQIECLFPFGFVMGKRLQTIPKHFRGVDFQVPLHVHPGCKFAVRSANGVCCFLTGELVHPDHPDLDIDELAELLVEVDESVQPQLDKLIGRFAFIVCGPDGTLVQNDASGMRSIYYSLGGEHVVVGSHAQLVAQAAGDVTRNSAFRKRKLGCAGIATPYQGVRRLNPNVLLDVGGRRLRRFFPVAEIPPSTVDSSWEFAFTNATIAARGFSRRQKLLASLSAGKDSRATLLALRDVWSDTLFFTYTKGVDSHDIDCDVASTIAQTLDLNHVVLDYAGVGVDKNVGAFVKRNTFGTHQHNLAVAYRDDERMANRLHVRSNMLELTRSNLYSAAARHGRFQNGLCSANELAEYYAAAGNVDRDDYQEMAFAQYRDTCDHDSARRFMSSWDLYFIEHRMGAWRSGIIEESDIAFDTVNVFNSREILTHFYGTPEAERAESTVLESTIGGALPRIASIPFNPKKRGWKRLFEKRRDRAAASTVDAAASDPGNEAIRADRTDDPGDRVERQ